ncbi:hypothetical protein BJ508DRAFT_142497 [Ascobolus immersus RN42]|uniref:GST N-terminal domain-containing protein n=1 Tax=Ascobolus immersus RN42 TaxID=1160509 RepID=A0A3N4I079_ASCIM|nr:hypothetical protein BJ508DRAFT_142497 [Ascobolus immersus RN42]
MTAVTNPFYTSKAIIPPYSGPRIPQPHAKLPGLLSQIAPDDASADEALHLTLMSPQFSSWTSRVLLLFEHFRIPYTAEFHNYNNAEGKAVIQGLPARTVPVLTLGKTLSDLPNGGRQEIHDSMAIMMLMAYELFAEKNILPKDVRLRRYALSIIAEMSTGFSVLRGDYSVNFGLQWDPDGVPRVEGCDRDIDRAIFIFSSARKLTKSILPKEEDRGYLFGSFSAADSWYWPLLWRFRTYGLLKGKTLDNDVKKWINKMWNDETTKRIGEEQIREREEGVATLEYLETLFDPTKKWEWGNWVDFEVDDE